MVTLVYTSGTTGPPKGAMLTAGNVNFAIEVLFGQGGLFATPAPATWRSPICRSPTWPTAPASEWLNAHAGAQVHFAESIEDVLLCLREVQPSLFLAVPRIWEKLRATVEIRMASASR